MESTASAAASAESLRRTRIRDAAVEREFRMASLSSDERIVATLCAAWLLAVVVPPSIAFAAGAVAAPLWLVATRVLFSASLVAAALLAPRQREPARLDLLVLGLVVVSSGLTFAQHSWVARGDISFLIVDAIPVFGLWTVMPNRFLFQGIAAALLSVRTLLVLVLFRDPLPWKIWMSTIIALVIANGVGAFASWTLHRSRRLQFLAMREQRAARESLETALAQVRTLRGLVPMCTSCKAIRMPDGTWRRLEEVLAKSTEAELTHGFCDACLERLYPE